MNVRLDHQNLRIRLSAEEFAELRAGKRVHMTTRMPGLRFRAEVEQGEEAHVRFGHFADGFLLVAPSAELTALAARLPSKEGLEWRVAVDAQNALLVSLEVDAGFC
ncbi:MAG: hypothetical protein HYV16_14080 [Gammaproteobacteria bacterium]|nr:hypothetical protein [Gammaproteobacteria bacterium]